MRRIPRNRWFYAAFMLFAVFIAGCDDNGHNHVKWIYSDPRVDADINRDLSTGALSAPALAYDTGEIIAGLTFTPPSGPSEYDYRGFLEFPLDAVPSGATVDFASLTIYLNGVVLGNTNQYALFFVDLIDTSYYTPPILSSDYSSPYVSTLPFYFFSGDQGDFVEIEVTSLMRDAQALRLPSFRVRIGFDNDAYMADPGSTRGLVRIYDGPSFDYAPLLRVDYR